MSAQRNALCPCGSGKKIKKCFKLLPKKAGGVLKIRLCTKTARRIDVTMTKGLVTVVPSKTKSFNKRLKNTMKNTTLNRPEESSKLAMELPKCMASTM